MASGTSLERAERAERKVDTRRSKDKAIKMRMVEGGTFVVASMLIGGLEARFPTLAAFGPGERLNLSILFLAVGGVAMFMGKGYTREFGSGLVYSGAGNMLQKFGVQILGPE